MKIALASLGSWGTALGNHLANNGFQVLGYSRDKELVNSVNSSNINFKYFPDLKLNKNLKATNNFNQLLDAEFFLLAVSSSALNDILDLIPKDINITYISAIKGFDTESCLTPVQILNKRFSNSNTSVISGPSFAIDLIKSRPVAVVAASSCKETKTKVSKLFRSDKLRVYESNDTTGVECGGIYKNIIAIAAGICEGLDLGESAKAALVSRGLSEMLRFTKSFGGKAETVLGLSGLGDLVLTASSKTSRNFSAGLLYSKGLSTLETQKEIGYTVEGIKAAQFINKYALENNLDLPIALKIYSLIKGEARAKDLVKDLLTRESTNLEFS